MNCPWPGPGRPMRWVAPPGPWNWPRRSGRNCRACFSSGTPLRTLPGWWHRCAAHSVSGCAWKCRGVPRWWAGPLLWPRTAHWWSVVTITRSTWSGRGTYAICARPRKPDGAERLRALVALGALWRAARLGAAGRPFPVGRLLLCRELLPEVGVEGRQVVRGPAGDQAMVHHDLLVHPRGTGVLQIGAQAGVGGQGAAAQHIGLGEDPRAVADHRHRFAVGEETAGDLHRAPAQPQ